MALITRVSRLFRADLHAVLDHIEEPDLLLRQAVREMEEELVRNEQRIKLLRHEKERITSQVQDIDQSLAELEEELDICFASGKDDLARTLIRRKLESQRLRKHLGHKGEALHKTLDGLTAQLKEQRSQLEAMRQKAELLAVDDVSGVQEEQWHSPDFAVLDADVEVAFLREKQKRSRQ